jgi:hypothetical protein
VVTPAGRGLPLRVAGLLAAVALALALAFASGASGLAVRFAPR